MEEKDLFDLFREKSENLTEQPTAATWQRLERRLASARGRKRRSVPLQLIVAATAVALFACIGIVSWVVTREHAAVLKNKKQFSELTFLVGKWSASEKNVGDVLVFEQKDSAILRGLKTVEFKNATTQRDTFEIQQWKKQIVLHFQKQEFDLKTVDNQLFTFMSADGSTVRLRRSAKDRFTLSFGDGRVFVYKKM